MLREGALARAWPCHGKVALHDGADWARPSGRRVRVGVRVRVRVGVRGLYSKP